MSTNFEDLGLRQALLDATIGQPDAPVDRLAGVRRRHTRRRVAQLSAAAAIAAAAVVGSLLGVGSLRPHAADELNRPVPPWALRYDDHRDGSVPQHVLDGAVTAWKVFTRHEPAALPTGPVTWYVGNLVADKQSVAVIFEAQHRLVGAVAPAEEVMHGQPPVTSTGNGPNTPWEIFDAPAPPPTFDRSFHGVIGLNVHGPVADATQSLWAENWALVLAPPTAHSAYVAFGGTIRLDHGYGAVETPHLVTDQPLEVSAKLANGRVIGGYIGVPGNASSFVPQLAEPPPFTDRLPAGIDLGAVAAQGTNGASEAQAHRHGTVVAEVLCTGPGPLTLLVNDQPMGRVRCDGRQHRVRRAGVRPQRHYIQILVSGGNDFTVYRLRAVLIPQRP